MSLYTLAFREDEGASCSFGPQERLALAVQLMATVGDGEADGVVVLPAGYVLAPSTARRDEWAEALAASSRNAGVGVVFGIDVEEAGVAWGMERCPRSFAYACDRGRRLLWNAGPTGRAALLDQRTVTIGALRMTVLFARELFGARSTAAVEKARPDLAIILGHAGPTKRWVEPLAALDELAPTLVVHQALPVCRPVAVPPPRGWRPAATRGAVRVVAYRREADGAPARVVGN